MTHKTHRPSPQHISLRKLEKVGRTRFALLLVTQLSGLLLVSFWQRAGTINVQKVLSEPVPLHLLPPKAGLSFLGGKPVTWIPTWSNQVPKGGDVNGELKSRTFFFLTFYYVLKKL